MNRVAQQAGFEEKGPDFRPRAYDYEAILPMELVREHTKTDDVLSVTDAQLSLYRKAALEAAEAYTGLPLVARRVQTEVVSFPRRERDQFYMDRPNYIVHRATGVFAEPQVYFYGKGVATQVFMVTVGTNTVRLPIPFDFGIGCCNPCGSNSIQAHIQYVSGFSCESDIPAAIRLGALKYIAHTVENLGDKIEKLGGVLTGREANPALASGAIEIWRSAVPSAI